MNDAKQRPDAAEPQNPQNQASEEHGKIKSRQRGEGDFKGRADTPRGSEPETASAARRRV